MNINASLNSRYDMIIINKKI